jgi:hypothetical protein
VSSSSPRHLQRIFRTTPVSRASSVTCTGDLPDDLRELSLRPVRGVTVRIEAAPYSSEEFLGAKGLLSPQLTAFFTSAAIFASSAAVSSFSAKEVGHMLPSSRFAESLKPNVAYLSLNFDAGVK